MRALPITFAIAAVLFLALASPRPAGALSESQITLSYTVVGGEVAAPPSVWYFVNGQNVSATLGKTPTLIVADSGSSWGVPQYLGGGTNYLRWELSGDSGGVVSGQTLVLTYFTQYYATFGLPLKVNATAAAPLTVNYTSLGVEETIAAGQSAWADNASAYSYSTVPSTSTDTRWYAPSPNGFIEGAFAINPQYFLQYLQNFSLSTAGTEPLQSTSFVETFGGGTLTTTLNAPGGPYWADANSTLAFEPTIYSQSGTERWVMHSMSSTVAVAPANVSVKYFEQFPFSFTYGISSGQAPSGPILNVTANGQKELVQVYPGAPAAWVDAGSRYFFSQLLMGSTSVERWLTTANTTGVASGPTSLDLEYFHQVRITIDYSIAGGGEIPQPNANYFSFGAQGSLPLETVQQSAWVDSGSTLSFPVSFAGGTPAERWMLGSASSVDAITPQTISLVYYHQYLVPTAYDVVGGGSPSLSALTGVQFGSTISSPMTPTGSVWLDGGSVWSVPGLLPGSAGERWVAVGQTKGTVGAAAFPALSYRHQFYVTVTSDPAGIAALTPGGWVDAGQSFAVTEQPLGGWALSQWVGSGGGSYTGRDQNFTATVSSPIQETADFNIGIAVQTTGSGSVKVSFGSSSYTVKGESTFYVAPGTNITLVAEPGFFQSFRGWVGIPAGSVPTVVMTAEAPLGVGAGFGINLIAALAVVVVVCGGLVYLVAYVAWNKRVSPRRLLGSRGEPRETGNG